MSYFVKTEGFSKHYLITLILFFLILVPLSARDNKVQSEKIVNNNLSVTVKNKNDILHTVKKGECLWSIANQYYDQYNVSATKLLSYNNLNGVGLYPGMVIKVPRDEWQIPKEIVGLASWYGDPKMARDAFHGQKTANGEIYNTFAMTAAHKTLPLGTMVEVINPRNHLSVVVRINDRGPYIANRVIDLSYMAAQKLGISGVENVIIRPLKKS